MIAKHKIVKDMHKMTVSVSWYGQAGSCLWVIDEDK